MRIAKFLSIALLSGLALCPLSCQSYINQTTGRRQYQMLTLEQEIEIGSKSQGDFIKKSGGHIPSKGIQRYVSDLGHQLANQSLRKDLPWEFHTLNSNSLNAFALPGGKVFITRGLLSKLKSRAELAGVLGHEVGHITAKHFNDKIARNTLTNLLGAGINIYASSQKNKNIKAAGTIAPALIQTISLSYDRDQELESDRLGLEYMSALGFNPKAQVQVMYVLKGASGNAPAEIFSTHPHPETRIAALKKLLVEKYPRHSEPRAYQTDAASYREQVLDVLSKLPAPPKAKAKVVRGRGKR